MSQLSQVKVTFVAFVTTVKIQTSETYIFGHNETFLIISKHCGQGGKLGEVHPSFGIPETFMQQREMDHQLVKLLQNWRTKWSFQ